MHLHSFTTRITFYHGHSRNLYLWRLNYVLHPEWESTSLPADPLAEGGVDHALLLVGWVWHSACHALCLKMGTKSTFWCIYKFNVSHNIVSYLMRYGPVRPQARFTGVSTTGSHWHRMSMHRMAWGMHSCWIIHHRLFSFPNQQSESSSSAMVDVLPFLVITGPFLFPTRKWQLSLGFQSIHHFK